ncbi:MAG TPA: helix-turn-helix domain-containing protein [Chloroflexota bacterium]
MATATKPTAPLPLRELRSALGLSREKMGRLLEVSARTIERWEATGKTPSRPSMRRRFEQLQEIVELGRIGYTPEGLVYFLQTPFPTFDGRTGLQLIEIGEGKRVFGVLAGEY